MGTLGLGICNVAGLLFSTSHEFEDEAGRAIPQDNLKFSRRSAALKQYAPEAERRGRFDAWCGSTDFVEVASPSGGTHGWYLTPFDNRTWLVEYYLRHEFCNFVADSTGELAKNQWFFSTLGVEGRQRPDWLVECMTRSSPWQVASVRPRYVVLGPGVEVTFTVDDVGTLLVGKRGQVCIGTSPLVHSYKVIGARRDEQTGVLVGVAEIADAELLVVPPTDIRLLWGLGDSCDSKQGPDLQSP
jgi:hypothetical protein